MIKIALSLCLLAACGDNIPEPGPDASTELPSCADVGCPPPMPLLCTGVGICICPQPDGERIMCRSGAL